MAVTDTMAPEAAHQRGIADSSEKEVATVNIGESMVPDWTEAEENAVKRKLDFILLPIMGLAFFSLQLDRGNIANALTDTITQDLHITTNDVNVGNALLSTGIVLLEIPSNILLQKVGPHKWLSFQIFAWGLVALFQAFIHNYAGFLATRILLGLAESGFIPGALYTLSTWYKKGESNLRISLFFLGNCLGVATTSLIGAGILSISGRYGIAGWRWLFIIEGSLTVAIGFLFFAFLPRRVGEGSPWISFGKWSYFTPRESDILVRRVLIDDPAKISGQKVHISARDVWTTVKNPRILIHVLITMSATIPVNAINTYGPSVIKSLGYDAVRANALASIGQFISVALVVLLGYLADKFNRKAPALMVPAVWSLIAFTCLRQSFAWNTARRLAAVIFSSSTNSTVHILNVGWLSVNCRKSQERSIAMAMIVMGANSGAIAGSQVFRTNDAPLYVNAFTACLTMSTFVLIIVIGQACWYHMGNRGLAKAAPASEPKSAAVVDGEAQVIENGETVELVKPWKWTW